MMSRRKAGSFQLHAGKLKEATNNGEDCTNTQFTPGQKAVKISCAILLTIRVRLEHPP